MANGRGGYREGAGRKTKYAKRLQDRAIAAAVLASIDEIKAWQELLMATATVGSADKGYSEVPDYKTRLETLKYLTDRVDGRAFVAVNPASQPKLLGNDPKLLMAIQNLQIVSQSPIGNGDMQTVDTKGKLLADTDGQTASTDSVRLEAGKTSSEAPSEAIGDVR